uniref:Mannosyltransferase n=1 Tax=Lygus hesperus TaxID=30085 RepID=A0A146LIZ0_LYGHE
MKRDIHETKNPDENFDVNPNFRPHVSLAPYWLLAFLRIFLTFVPQTGYIHPDEFFQSLEVINGDVFQVVSNRPWEFNATLPIRSITLPYLIVGTPLLILKNISPFLNLWFDINCITPYSLIVVPRVVCCLLSFITDISLYKICFLYGQNYRCRLITLASSFVMLIYGSRTFSNTIEMALASLLIYFVAESMARTDQIIYQDEYLRERYNSSNNIKDRIRFHRMRLALPWHSFSGVFFIATVTVLGVFNRPTFLAFAFPPIFFWLLRGMGSQVVGLSDFNMRSAALVVSALPALLGLTIIDSAYYGALTSDEILNKNVSILRDLVFTPYNFIRYNIDSKNLAQHGIHPRFTHFLVNIPVLFNVLGIAGLLTFVGFLYRGAMKQYSSLPRVQSIIGLMTASFILPVAFLSVFPHQEARFLIPVTLPLVFLYTQKIRKIEDTSLQSRSQNGFHFYTKKDGKKLDTKDGLLVIWYAVNILLTLFFGFIHQAGVIPLVSHMNKEMATKPRLTMVHLVTSHLYPLPISLMFLRFGKSHQFLDKSGSRYQRARDFFNYEMGSSISMDTVALKLSVIVERAEETWREKRMKYKVYYAGPSSLTQDLQASAFKYDMNATIERVFYPHISAEAFPKDPGWTRSDVLKTLSNFAHQMGLSLVRLTPLPRSDAKQLVLDINSDRSPPQQTVPHESRTDNHFCPVRRVGELSCSARAPLYNAQH